MPPKKSYTLALKHSAVEKVIGSSNRGTARALNVDERRIREWHLQFPTLRQQTSIQGSSAQGKKRCRLQGRRRKPLLPSRKPLLPSRKPRRGIALKAAKLAAAQGHVGFKTSRGWVDKFIKRYDFCIRQKTTTGQRLPPELTDKVTNFVLFCKKLYERYYFEPGAIGNMNETAIMANMPRDNSVDKKGVATVPILTTGHEKNRVTVCLAALGDGRKLLPLMVFKGKRMPKELQNVRGVVIEMSSNRWMQGPTTLAWIEKCWAK